MHGPAATRIPAPARHATSKTLALRTPQAPFCSAIRTADLAPTAMPAEVDTWQFRQYDHVLHQHHVTDICKDVYGGTDYMPRMLHEYSQDPLVFMLVAVAQDESVDAIVGAAMRGDIVFLFGLRVRQSTRGKGLGRQIMAAICQQATTHFQSKHPVRSLATITITLNKPAQRIIQGELPGPHQRVYMWPCDAALSDYEQAIQWPTHQANASGPRLLHSIPGALELLQADDKAVQALSQWRVAKSAEEVRRYACAVRAGHAASHEQRHKQESSGGCLYTGVEQLGGDWLPTFFDMSPATSAWSQEQIAQGRVWLLDDPGCTNGHPHTEEGTTDGRGQPAGVLLMARSVEGRRWTAGIVAADDSVAHSALLKCDKLQPHFVAFIDNGSVWSHDPQQPARDVVEDSPVGHRVPPVCTLGSGTKDLLVYGKRL